MRRTARTPSGKAEPFETGLLRSNRTMVKTVIEFLVFAGPDAPPETVDAAVSDLLGVMDHVEEDLRSLFPGAPALGASRLPARRGRPLTPAEALDALETALDIMRMEVEILLREPWTDEERYRRVAQRRDHVIKMMGHMARYYKSVIRSRDPSVWTPEVERRFSKFLRIEP